MKVVTIDGSSWTGKSTVAHALAKRLGYRCFPTGLLYRAAAYFLLHNNISPDLFGAALGKASFSLVSIEGIEKVHLNGLPLPAEVEHSNYVATTSKIAEMADVRTTLLDVQQKIIEPGGFVIEGRDTGTVIAPSARWKFFLDARLDVKVARFFKTLSAEERARQSEADVRRMIMEVDERDRTRKTGPLRCPSDAIVYDNSESPTAEYDAVILWYYITHPQEIIQNVELVKQWKD